MLKELVEYIIQQLVEEQQAVEVVTRQEESALVVQVTVAAKDRGRVIGRDGQTIKALKAFLGVISPAGVHIIIDLIPAAS
jgi:predicted RNA-binding protein YlqC (UPF0109 family)